MSNKQIAYLVLNQMLASLPPRPDDLRDTSGIKLSDGRCQRIAQMVSDKLATIRQPIAQYLNNTGFDTV